MKDIINLNTLHNIITVEIQKGYSNTSVIGGLNRYISKWASEIRDNVPSKLLKARFDELVLSCNYYDSWNTEQRKQWVENLAEWLSDLENSNPVGKKKKSPNNTDIKSVKNVLKNDVTARGRELDSPVTLLKGIKTETAAKFNKLGIKTIRDLLYLFPRYHVDYSQKKSISELTASAQENAVMGPETVFVNIWEAKTTRLGSRRMNATELIFGDETGNATAIWYNQPYLSKRFSVNSRIVISGKYKIFKGKIIFQSPDWDYEDTDLVHAGRLVPVYPLTRGLYQRQMRSLLKRVVDNWSGVLTDFVPESVKRDNNLLNLVDAIRQAHFPDNNDKKTAARNRLAFDELFLIQLGLIGRKKNWQDDKPGIPIKTEPGAINSFLSSLPFELTNAQNHAIEEILRDMGRAQAMSRLLQGEVGSGKTIVAITAILAAVSSGCQVAFMAPTEILAEQHFHSLNQLLGTKGQIVENNDNICSFDGILSSSLKTALLVGKIKARDKEIIQERISGNDINIVIGTHALIQKDVEFKRLGFVIIDEQHRFGVLQRSSLRQKGFNPHLLVMTATPIPRTLALTLYGDLDISVLDQLPPGRQQIITRWVKPDYRIRCYDFIRKQVVAGHQAFLICPLIEESENIEAKAATEEYERLSKEIFSDLRVGLLHGRMSSAIKEETMKNFRDGKLDILVSTPVVEVGIDIPNATVILIEAAERFGLSQLHQFRGRVGRGTSQSYCLLLSENPTDEAVQRLSSIETIHDGFKLAEKDLELRGPGDFMGTRQSGLPNLVMAKLSDAHLLEMARGEALKLFLIDPKLESKMNLPLAKEINRVWQNVTEWS